MANKETIGILITNLGTPDTATAKDVKTFLAEFLSDPFVVQIPKVIWWFILNGIILRVRPKKTAALYKKIWTESGSPLLVMTLNLAKKLRSLSTNKHSQLVYEVGMRYGNPSLKTALSSLRKQGLSKIVILPLYPQFSTTTTASTFAEIKKQLQLMNWHPDCYYIENYAQESSYINAIAKSITLNWQQHKRGQKLLFSFHGIPKRLIAKGDPYYDQCLSTALKVAANLNLNENDWQIVFQSRFGREQWLQPYCVEVLKDLAHSGIKSVDIICPGFPIDCLETLEEISIANKKIFFEHGGTSLNYIPALNDSDLHVAALDEIIAQFTSPTRGEVITELSNKWINQGILPHS